MLSQVQEEEQRRAEHRLAFLKHLPRRLDLIARRSRRFEHDGWDVNGLWLLCDDTRRLVDAAVRCGATETRERLDPIHALLHESLAREAFPDAEANARLLELVSSLAPERAMPTDAGVTTHYELPTSSAGETNFERAELAPAHYWRRWVTDLAPTPVPAPKRDAEPALAAPPEARPKFTDQAPSPKAQARPAEKKAMFGARLAPITKVPQKTARPSARIYHLSDAGELALELDQRLETLGYELELLESGDELREVLTALAPDLVIVDGSFQNELESIGAVLRSTRERTGAKLPLLALAQEDSVPVRLAARRAGADALLVKPKGASEVLAKIQELLEASTDANFRVLIVEDDRSQALFAESILRNAGMDAQVVGEAFEVLNAMDQFKPDLVLMDLYMPECDGTELTALIREREQFINTPIVFLSGESDIDKHYQALDAGGDDFLSKPIRPKHLISAVSNRVRRARAMQKRVGKSDPRDAITGLYARSHLLEQVNDILSKDGIRSHPGGVVFLDVDGVATLRERLGLSGIEQLLAEVGSVLSSSLELPDFASRYGDGCFVVVCADRSDGLLETMGVELRSGLSAHSFSVGGRPLRLRVSVGVCAFRHGYADAAALMNLAERTSREARASERGVTLYEPPKRAEDEQANAVVAMIRTAIDRDGFEFLYQPIVAIQGGDEKQFQTLLRMRDGSGHLHTAGQILPLAERHDLMPDVDRWVLARAIRVLEQRHRDGREVRLFVNQSASTLIATDHPEWVAGQLRARNVSGALLVIELTLEDIELQVGAVVDFCEALLPVGVQFCLSHFDGSAIGDSVLEKLPVAFLKLAPKYLAAAQTSSLRDELRVTIDKAHLRSLKVIAQRVEDAQSAATLWMSGIDYIQGNLVQQAGHDMAFDFNAAVI